VTVSLVLGVLSAIALVVEYLALCDIAQKPSGTLEWYVVGGCMIVMAIFVAVALVTLRVLMSSTPHNA
jgi:uncharacterized membrane protein